MFARNASEVRRNSGRTQAFAPLRALCARGVVLGEQQWRAVIPEPDNDREIIANDSRNDCLAAVELSTLSAPNPTVLSLASASTAARAQRRRRPD